jgi:hypothetical protein
MFINKRCERARQIVYQSRGKALGLPDSLAVETETNHKIEKRKSQKGKKREKKGKK